MVSVPSRGDRDLNDLFATQYDDSGLSREPGCVVCDVAADSEVALFARPAVVHLFRRGVC